MTTPDDLLSGADLPWDFISGPRQPIQPTTPPDQPIRTRLGYLNPQGDET